MNKELTSFTHSFVNKSTMTYSASSTVNNNDKNNNSYGHN